MTDVYVIDTSSLIQLLDDWNHETRWNALVECAKWVEDGKLVFPTQVEKELTAFEVPDSITSWAAGVRNARKFPDPDYKTVRSILTNQAVQKVVDWSKATKADPADPYVLAMAVELVKDGHDACIVTEDRRDKPDGYGKLKKSSIVTCCAALSLSSMPMSQFLPLLGIKPT